MLSSSLVNMGPRVRMTLAVLSSRSGLSRVDCQVFSIRFIQLIYLTQDNKRVPENFDKTRTKLSKQSENQQQTQHMAPCGNPSCKMSNPEPLPDLYLDSFSYPAASIVFGDRTCVIISSIVFLANPRSCLERYRQNGYCSQDVYLQFIKYQ